MDLVAVLVVMVTIFVWTLVSASLTRADLSAPIVFVVVGGVLAATDLVDRPSAPETLTPLVEVTLVWVLFSDAARVPVREFRHEVGQYVRLLGVGLPLTILAGWALAAWMFPELDLWLALVVGAALAPTDAALGVPVVTNPVVPSRVRRLITVESGLNDGIATPVVMLAIAGAASAEGIADAPGLREALLELLVGAVVGGAVGGAGGWLLRTSRARGWAAEDFAGIAVLALALVGYAGAVTVGGNGFVAAFCGGMAFGATAGRRRAAELVFLEQVSGLASLFVWLAFGVVALTLVAENLDLTTVLYAVLSLTVVRMVPVALAALGAGLDRGTVLFVGWFGPRGLASLVFALLALEELGADSDRAVAVVGMTVLLSVVAHGVSAGPLAARYGASGAARRMEAEGRVDDLPVRGLPRAPVRGVGDR
ncbi:cation:proton antiporter [Nocardioides sp. Soil805]|uniref:cation:proton antiporter n=1 Tax=Nocardioides sp. Soil805 TaxID=1736416 RepID=UPI00070368CC|nr:cation:proton antiporter [Nocardioides sp. Soil805]KRF34150.1 sodium:proton antiporter [Nocardioides sp. Soil805]